MSITAPIWTGGELTLIQKLTLKNIISVTKKKHLNMLETAHVNYSLIVIEKRKN